MQVVERKEVLNGLTYKLKIDHLTNALYVTINHIEIDGEIYPQELFINSLDPSTLKWTPLLARLVSAMFRTNADVKYIVKELNELFEAEPFFYKGKKYYSISQIIAEIIDKHCSLIQKLNESGKTNSKEMSEV